MNHRLLALCLASLFSLAHVPSAAQGLRAPGAGAARPSATPSIPLPTAPLPRQADFIVAVVNSEPITNNEVLQRLARIEQQLAAQGGNAPPRDVVARQVLERLVLEKVQLQAARAAAIKVETLAVTQAEQNVARQNDVAVDEMHRELTRNGISVERFREELRNQLMMQRLREREVESRVRISDVDVELFIREEQATTDPDKIGINLGHVLVIVPDGASAERVAQLRTIAQEAADKARAGTDFAAVAREYSDAPEGKNAGGLLGLRASSQYPDLFVSAVQGQQINAIVGPVRSPAGFHVLKVVERVIAGLPTTVPQSNARHILLRTSPQFSEAAAAERLADYRSRVLAGQADFAELARQYSQDASAKQGGALGWSNPGQFVPEFEQVLNTLEPGQISEPLVSRFGVHLIQLLERREKALTQREQREVARLALREKRLDEAHTNWLQELRARAYVEYRDPPQ